MSLAPHPAQPGKTRPGLDPHEHSRDRPHDRQAGCGCGCGCGGSGGGCGDLPELARLSYFHGQPLSALDLRREQAFHRDRARLHNRLLHGWGVVCGLEVVVPQPRPRAECDGDPTHAEVILMPGVALDCLGNEIVVRHPRPVDLESLLSEADRKRFAATPGPLHLALYFHEVPIDPTRPLLPNDCGPSPDCRHARVLDSYRVVVALEPFDRGPACEPCCGGCGDTCVEVAVIEEFSPGKPLTQTQVELFGRRTLAVRELTEIVGVNWLHAATYTRAAASELIEGLELWFSQGVEISTLVPEVVELTVTQGGRGNAATTYQVQTAFQDLPGGESAGQDYTDRARFGSTTQETLQYGDLVTITVRGDFILDECCRALDADHLGGAVPFRGDRAVLAKSLAGPIPDPPRCPPRPSGDGVEGGEFVSWIHVEQLGDKS